MTDAENIPLWELFNALANYYQHRRHLPDMVYSWIAKTREFINNPMMLEIGCGYGGWFGDFQDIGFKCEGIEQAPGAVKIARHNHMDSQIYSGKIQDVILEKKYDLIFCCGVLMHNKDYQKHEIMKVVSSLLKDDSYFLMCENTITDKVDEYCLSREEWVQMVNQHGFRNINIYDSQASNTWYLFQKVN